MSIINILDDNTINQIAAGEVVEKPAAIVKELVENSIDAGSTAVTVEVKNGGLDMIRITDNGKGIAPDDVRLAFERHATSKINDINDLMIISSLGFRGEALASIASVAKMECITKQSDDITGIRYVINGGNEETYQEVGCPDGTTFVVRDIFYNTPARRKFLKTPATEGSYITELMEKLALSHPEISFKYIYNGQLKINTVGLGDLKDVIYRIYGRDITGNILPINHQTEGINITGFIGRPIVARGNRGFISCFVNGRYIKSPILFRAIEEGYHGYFMQHKFPFAVLLINISQDSMDVNVHPSKQEIRFKESDKIYSAVNYAVKTALKDSMTVREVSVPDAVTSHEHPVSKKISSNEVSTSTNNTNEALDSKNCSNESSTSTNNTNEALDSKDNEKKESKTKPTALKIPEPFEINRINELKDNSVPYHSDNIHPVQTSIFDEKGMENERLKDINVVGCVFSTYWIIEYHNEMYILDQHAAHEKVMYEQYSKNVNNKTVATQIVSPPTIITLSPKEASIVNNNISTFELMGFGIEHFGGNEYIVNRVPADLPGIEGREIFIDMISSLLGEDNVRTRDSILLDKIASMSCKAAVKGNKSISKTEAEALVKQLFSLDNPFNCPHGRPTMIKMTKYELEKKFGRIV